MKNSPDGGDRRTKNKRYFEGKRDHRNPKRGGPGILLTCEGGREGKCRREGLEILQYYWENSQESQEQKNEERKMSLEEELAALKHTTNKDEIVPFTVYETGCKGTVFVMCTIPDCNLIPPIEPRSIDGGSKPGNESAVYDEQQSASKRARLDDQEPAHDKGDQKLEGRKSSSDSPIIEDYPWDPLKTVRSVVQDLSTPKSKNDVPGSRFVTRMIPIQATCFASQDEIHQTVRALLRRLLNSLKGESYSFSIQVKRRNCGHLTRDQIIEGVAGVVGQMTTAWTVKLREPDVIVMVEICKTLCGISILTASEQSVARNFNLAELRTKAGVASE